MNSISGAIAAIGVIIALVGIAANLGVVPGLSVTTNPQTCASNTFTASQTPSGAPICFVWSLTPPNSNNTVSSAFQLSVSGYIWPATAPSPNCISGCYTPQIKLLKANFTVYNQNDSSLCGATCPILINLPVPLNQGSCIAATSTGQITYCPFGGFAAWNASGITVQKAGGYLARLSVLFTTNYCPSPCQFGASNAVESQFVLLNLRTTSQGYGPQVTPDFRVTTNGLYAYFNDTSYTFSGSVTAVRWTFGDSGTGTGSAVTHRYNASGNYQVTEIVTFLPSGCFGGCGGQYSTNLPVTVTAGAQQTVQSSLPSPAHTFINLQPVPTAMIFGGVALAIAAILPGIGRNYLYVFTIGGVAAAVGFVVGAIATNSYGL